MLTAAGVRPFLALTSAGILIGAKAALGRLGTWRADRHALAVVLTALVALLVLAVLVLVGVPQVWAAVVAGVIGVVPVLGSLLGRRVDGFGLLVLAEIAASVVVTVISDDPRFVLARVAVYTAVAGVYVLFTCVVGRPIMLDATKPMAAAGDPVRAQAFENAWSRNARFRAVVRADTAGLGVVLLAESVLRVLVVYGSTEPNVAVTGLLAQVPAVALIVVWFLLVRVFGVPRARAVVDQEAARLR